MPKLNKESYSKIRAIADEVEKVIVGKRDTVKLLLIALLSEGHVLIEDVPGVGKTTIAKALGLSMGLVCKRVQFTPDIMASDITGFSMFDKERGEFRYRQGLVVCNIFLADEINRTSPKTQSALLESMEEKTVTVDSKVYHLPKPFMVVATQNEMGYVGTYPLPEAQLDRFLMKISMGYPDLKDEVEIISDRQHKDPLSQIHPVCTEDELNDIIEGVKEINIESSIYEYIVKIVSATRSHSAVTLGASPRASLMLMRASQSCAFVMGRIYVTPEDVVKMVPHVLSHRLILTQEARMNRINELNVLEDIVKSIHSPFTGKGS